MPAARYAVPSRASILTGKYPTNHGITTWIGDSAGEAWNKRGRNDSHLPPEYERNLRASEITLAEAMRNAGYKLSLPANGIWARRFLAHRSWV
jgi:arylsulfatase A-like enzyme